MELIADILMIFGTVVVSLYCMVLSRRLRSFTDLEKGMGGAIAVLSVQVDDMTKTLANSQKSAAGSAVRLQELNERAEQTAKRLELLIASMHDLPDVTGTSAPVRKTDSQMATTTERASDEDENVVTTAFFSSQRTPMEAAE
ncbi:MULTISPECIES: hypothetical protein [Alphaproteobacteria]|uniref:hypothetical protein n=1 Tax=Alphaproteobacteria TaxID=28211 RepID=UPI003A90072A